MRSDFELMSMGVEPQVQKLEEAIKKYPNSARLYFRLGTLRERPLSPSALKRAADLDSDNALPLYMLASAAAENGDPNQALDLVTQGNQRKRVDSYPLPYEPCKGNGLMEMAVVGANSSVGFPVFAHLKKAAMDIADYAGKLQSTGHTNEALAALSQAKRMGWKIMRAEHAGLINVQLGVLLVKICQKHEKQIYTEIGSKAGLAKITKENIKLRYLSAGSHAYIVELGPKLTRRLAVFTTFSIPLSPAVLEFCFTLVVLGIWGVFALRTRGKTASELHLQATSQAFALRNLLGLYAPIFLPIGIAAGVLFYLSASLMASSQNDNWAIILPIVIGVAVLLPSIILHCRAAGIYKKTYRQVSEEAGNETPRLWKGVPKEEKREVARRLAGVHGGAMVFLLIFGLLISGGMKLTLNAFPWQVDRATAGLAQEEPRYVTDLLDGKIKVPEKYIRERKQEEKEAEKRALQKLEQNAPR